MNEPVPQHSPEPPPEKRNTAGVVVAVVGLILMVLVLACAAWGLLGVGF